MHFPGAGGHESTGGEYNALLTMNTYDNFVFLFTITVLLIIINLDIIISYYYDCCYNYSGFYSFPSRSSCSQQPGMVARGLWAETTYSAQILPAWQTIQARVA